jgi:DNA-directed RNA polymerase specialized sigma24 family protein
MNINSDFRQEAAMKCLAANKLNAQDPYSGPYYRHAYKSVRIDAFRQHESRDRRIVNFFDMCPTGERYDADKRFRKDGLASDDPSKQAEAKEESELAIASLQRGMTVIRDLVAAHYLESRPTSELAREQGMTDPTIRNRIYRERERIKRELEALGITA